MTRSPPPITSAEIPQEWVATIKALAVRGFEFRKHATMPMLQSRAPGGQWGNQMLYTSAMSFVSVEERDLFWGRLWALPAQV